MKDILSQIKDRFSNPLIFSFIISWLISNWQITVALLWYDEKQIEKSGSHTIFEFISKKLNYWDSLSLPLIFALSYTFLMPIVKNIIRAFYSEFSKRGENWNLRILKGGQIPIEKYFKLKENYENRTKVLEETITSENELLDKYNDLNNYMLSIQSAKNEAQQKLTELNNVLSQFDNVSILNGYWTVTYQDPSIAALPEPEEVFIEAGRYFIIGKFGKRLHKFDVRNFHFDVRKMTMFFTKEFEAGPLLGDKGISIKINVLNVEKGDSLVGLENGTVNIQYVRKSNSVSTIPTEYI